MQGWKLNLNRHFRQLEPPPAFTDKPARFVQFVRAAARFIAGNEFNNGTVGRAGFMLEAACADAG